MKRTRAVIFTQAARQEFLDAQDWYEKESLGLGRRFLAEVDSAVERLAANPLQFPIVHRNIRRALLRRFPYALMFRCRIGWRRHGDRLFSWQP